MELLFSSNLGATDLFPILLNSQSKSLVNHAKFTYLQVKAFVLVPGQMVNGKTSSRHLDTSSHSDLFTPADHSALGYISYSGEKMEYSPLQIEILPSLQSVVIPYWFNAN